MKRSLLQQAFDRLSGIMPHQAAEELADIVAETAQARKVAASLWTGRGEPELLISRNVAHEDLERIERWARTGGAPVASDGFWITPFNGVAIYLSEATEPPAIVERVMESLGPSLASAALQARKTPSVESPAVNEFLERTPLEEIERRHFLLQLEKNEWNLSRVARLRGVDRGQIYRDMRRLGIERERRKIRRRLP